MMKRMINFFILFISIITLLHSANQNSIVFDKKLYDFGKVGQHQKVSTIFYYTNKSSSIINIKKVHTTCGCTIAEISKRWLRANESGKIKVIFNTRSYRGAVAKHVLFETEPPIKPLPQVTIRATVIPDVYLEPDNIFLRSIPRNSFIQRTVKVLSEKFTNFKITKLNYNKEHLNIKTQRYKDKNSVRYLLNITLYPQKIKKTYFSERVNIETSIKSAKDLVLIIHGYVH